MTISFETVIRTFCWVMMVIIFGSVLVNCATIDSSYDDLDASSAKDTSDQSGVSFDEGGTAPVIHMPFAAGHTSLCTQGAQGKTSHHSASTMYDIDFDTSNTSKEELRAPVSGTVYVHTEDASKNFGYHVNIDLGNATYVVLGHMSSVSVKDGQKVVAGQFLGYEGCTGYCSGDHVHVGLHAGDAKKMAQFGTSVPVRYMLSDKTAKTKSASVECTSLVCGIKSLGDHVNGHVYISALPSVHAQVVTPVSTPKMTPSSDLWITDTNYDGIKETLMLSASRWLDPKLSAQDAYVWGMGGCVDSALSQQDRVSLENGYYRIDFSRFESSCITYLTLISVTGTDGNAPNASMTNWNWWQNAGMCSQGSGFCHLQNNGTPWEEWMLRFSWNPLVGISAFGNGYTKNSQLP